MSIIVERHYSHSKCVFRRVQFQCTDSESSARESEGVCFAANRLDRHHHPLQPPLVKGRKIWGGLEPFGSVWRAGANENTTIEFSDPVSVEGKQLPKGIYGLHMIPGENEWTVIFSKNSTSWGSYSYDPAEGALRVTVKPQPSEFHEALTYEFDNLKADSATVALRWEKAANYLLTHKVALNDALKYTDESIQLEERFDNLIAKANVLDALGRKDEAAPVRTKAVGLARR